MATLYVGCEEAVFQCKRQKAKGKKYNEQITLQDQPARPAADPDGLRFPCGGRAYGYGSAAHDDTDGHGCAARDYGCTAYDDTDGYARAAHGHGCAAYDDTDGYARAAYGHGYA
jgi:hypothetical protein